MIKSNRTTRHIVRTPRTLWWGKDSLPRFMPSPFSARIVFSLLFIPLFFLTRAPMPAYAATSDNLNFQARLQTGGGAIAPDGYYNVEFKLYDAASAGTLLWTETRDYNGGTPDHRVRVANGYLTVNLGDVTGFPGTMPWDQQLYLTMNIGGMGTTSSWDGEMSPRLKLTAVPYAFNAKTASQLITTASGISSTLTLQAPTGGDQIFQIPDQGAAGTYTLLTGAAASGSYIQLQGTTPGSQQTGNFNISGTGIAATGLKSPTISLGTGGATTGSIELFSASNTNKVIITSAAQTAGDLALTIPNAGSLSDTVCLQTLANCLGGAGGGANTSLSNIASTNLSAALNVTGGDLTLQTTTSGNVNIAPVGTINLNSDTTIAAGKTITITGGNTAARPASPTEGMVYYDTNTKQLLQYNGTKWVSDRSTATKIVAASNSSQTIKDSADYVATGTDDQVAINAALAAAAGGKVYLAEGTYTTNQTNNGDATIFIPNNTTLVGAGRGTIIQLGNIGVAADNLIENADTTTGTGVTVSSLVLMGQKSVNSGTQNGIYFNYMGAGSGSSARQGATIDTVYIKDFVNDGIYINNSYNNKILGSTVQANNNYGVYVNSSDRNTVNNNLVHGNGSTGIRIDGASDNTINDNIIESNSATGIYMNSATRNTITGNRSSSNARGARLVGSSSNVISGNIMNNNSTTGISLESSSNSNTVSANSLNDNGSATGNEGIYISGSSYNTITSNTITDSSCTSTCAAIDIFDASSNKTYLADNRYSGSAANAASIADAGTGTIYAGQQTNVTTSTNSDISDFRFRGSANSTTAFSIQNAAGNNLLNIDSTNGVVAIGDTTVAGKLSLSDGSSNTATIQVSALAGNYTYTIPTTTGNDVFCLASLGNCAPSAGSVIQNQNSAAQTSANFWIDGVARADTSVLTPLLDTATAVPLNIGTTNATRINLNENTVLAASKTITITGGNTASRPASPTEGMVYYDTSTKQLLTYSNGKWQSDRSTATKIVAASNATQAEKDGADYVATGTNDQTTINSALAAAAGGKVYLTEGVYNIGAQISMGSDNTTLSGAGIESTTLKRSANFAYGVVDINGVNLHLSDLTIDGNKATYTTSTNDGVTVTWNSSSISRISTRNNAGKGINLDFTWPFASNLTVKDSIIDSNTVGGASGTGSSGNVTYTGNTVTSNGDYGIRLGSTGTVTNNTVTGNTNNGIELGTGDQLISNNLVSANGNYGIDLGFDSYAATIEGNHLNGNGVAGIHTADMSMINIQNNYIENEANGIILEGGTYGSDSVTVSGNRVVGSIYESIYACAGSSTCSSIDISNNTVDNGGGSGAADAIKVGTNAADTKVVNNTITDTAGTGYAIGIDAGATNTYLAGNTYSGTGASSIHDLGTGTRFAGQSVIQDGLGILFKQPNSTTAFSIQNASGNNLLNIDSTNGVVAIGDTTVAGKLSISDGSSNTATIQVSALAGNYTYTIPTTTGNDVFCLASLGNCAASAGSVIQNQNSAAQTSANFWIDGVARADTSVLTPLLDTATATALNIGTTNATSINLNQNTTLAAGKTITVTGGITSTRPVSPTPGMLYYDTTSNQLLTYNGTKWMSDKSTATVIVAANDSSQAAKDGANFVVSSADETAGNADAAINAAIATIPADGGVVYLAAGNYTVNDPIVLPTDTTLAGDDSGATIHLENTHNADINMVENSDPTGGNKRITVRDIKLDGNSSNQSGSYTQYGIKFVNVGSATEDGAKITNVTIHSTSSSAVYTDGSDNLIFTNSRVRDTGSSTNAVRIGSSDNATIANNYIDSAGRGVRLTNVTNSAVMGNVMINIVNYGLYIDSGSTRNTVTGNTVSADTYGVYITSADNNTISANTIFNSGGTTDNDAIYIDGSKRNIISNNQITDNSATSTNYAIVLTTSDANSVTNNVIRYTGSAATNNYAIDIVNSTSDDNYLSGNVFSSSPGNYVINDSGTGTVYAGQSMSEKGQSITFKQSNSTTAFRIQNAAGNNLLNIDSTNGVVVIGDTTVAGKLSISDGSSNTVTITSAAQTGNYTATIPTLTANATICTTDAICAGYAPASGSASYIQNQSSIQQASSDFWISGTGRADTSLLTPSIDTASAGTLNIGTYNASHVTIGYWGMTTEVAGGLTAVGTITSSTGRFDTTGAATLFIGKDNASSIELGQFGSDTTVIGHLIVNGGSLTLNTTYAGINFTTPEGTAVSTRINIPVYDVPDYGQILAFGVSSSSYNTSRALSVFDARHAAHQPTISVFDPSENDAIGFSWDGNYADSLYTGGGTYDPTAYIKTLGSSIGLKINGTVAAKFGPSQIDLNQDTVVAGGKTLSLGTAATYSTLLYGTLGTQLTYSAGSYPGKIESADLNGDGAPDLVVMSTGKISTLRNNGDGSFAAKVDYSYSVYDIAVADVNGDNMPDIVAVDYFNNTIKVLLNNGDGTFGAASTYSTGTGPRSLVLADFNGDGKKDVAVAADSPTAGADKMVVNMNNGDGTFATGVSYTHSGNSAWSIVAADLNGDGKPDIAMTDTAASTVSTYLNTGTGTFAGEVVRSTSTQPYGIAAADFNGDGKTDIAVTGLISSKVAIHLSNGDGTLAAQTEYNSAAAAWTVVATDLNGDGAPDLVTGSNNSTALAVHLNNGDGTFASKVDYALASGKVYDITAADFNGDGHQDIATANNSGGTASRFLNIGTPTTVHAGLSVNAAAGSQAGIIVQTASGQLADLMHLQSSAGAALFTVSSTGAVVSAGDITSAATIQAGTSILAPLLDTASAVALNIGTTNATSINLNQSTAIKVTSTTALQIQNATSTILFTADTSTGTITFGTGSNTVIFTASGGLVASGTAQHGKTIRLTPEYAGAVLDAQSDSACTAASNGTMTAGYDSTNRTNYYNWTSVQTTNQCYDVVVQVPIPTDFASWNSINIQAKTSNTTNSTYGIAIVDSSITFDANYGSSYATPGTLSTSWSNLATSGLSGTYTAGDYMTIKVRMSAKNSANLQLGNITLNYNSKF